MIILLIEFCTLNNAYMYMSDQALHKHVAAALQPFLGVFFLC